MREGTALEDDDEDKNENDSIANCLKEYESFGLTRNDPRS